MDNKVYYKTEIKLVILSKRKLDSELEISEIIQLIDSEELPGGILKKKVYLVTEERAKEILLSIDKNPDFFDEIE
jgi:hypothetical protein